MTAPSFTIDASPIPLETTWTHGWFTEHLSANERHAHRCRRILWRVHTPFQEATFAEFYAFGRCLILDGEIQSAQADEFIYHESLVQPAMALHPAPRDVLILGGGEGATAREVLRHRGVRRVTMVDIDEQIVKLCRRHLAAWHRGAFADARLRLRIDDAQRFLGQTAERFDVIISDLPTPAHPRGALWKLYREPFYERVRRCMRPEGVFVAQAGSGSYPQLGFHATLARTLRRFFRVVRPYTAHVPSFDGPWAFLLCSQGADPRVLGAAAVDKRLGSARQRLRFYDGETHQGLFHPPKYIRDVLRA
jgi:spermidine synthase